MKYYLTIFSCLVLIGCSSSVRTTPNKCGKLPSNTYWGTFENQFSSKINGYEYTGTLFSYDCVLHSFITKKVLFDYYGKWGDSFYLSDERHPIMIWKNRDILRDGSSLTILATGEEDYGNMNGSMMIFDREGNDMLLLGAEKRKELIEFVGTLIKRNDSKKRDFFEAY
ncbi:hypothetical protein ACFO3O_21170 [Dokdonia ponticola]|uniref:Copper resistance protein NlpE n=1 Tax=Dokdonia ponticola TaxID=2041041 RepID=A0ABV9I2U4_9FLAO